MNIEKGIMGIYKITSPSGKIYIGSSKNINKRWKDYLKSTNIQERQNIKLHVQYLPKRYWRYLNEKQL